MQHRQIKGLIAWLLAFALAASLGGCGAGTPASAARPYASAPAGGPESAPSGVVSQDGSLTLEWDAARRALLLKQDGGLLWSSMPYEQYLYQDLQGAAMRYLESHLLLEYIDPVNQQLHTVNSYTGVNEKGRLVAERIDGGIRLTYCFEEERIAVPVEYRLTGGALEAAVVTADICEDENLIYSLSVLPYAASVANSAENYLFVPDGSGMLMYCGDERAARTFQAPVYGGDLARTSTYQYLSAEAVRLPCYGAAADPYALFCIITDGAGSASVTATAGDENLTYSYAYTTFYLRGSDVVSMSGASGGKRLIDKYTTARSTYGRLAVRMTPLYAPEGDAYNQMAACYRDYLIHEKGLKQKEEAALLVLDLPMAVDVQENILGIPVKVTKAATSFAQAEDILRAVSAEGGLQPALRLSGVQRGGVGVSKIGGGFRLDGSLGSEGDLQALIQAAEETGAGLYPDFDLIRFRQGSSGFRAREAAAKLPTTAIAYQYGFTVDKRDADLGLPRYMLLSPAFYDEVVRRLGDLLKKEGFSGVSLSTFGSLYYSDFGRSEHFMGNGYDEAVAKGIGALQNSGFRTMASEANLAAAVAADTIYNAPLGTSEYRFEDQWIPFYAMVFKGYTTMTSAPLNLVRNGRREFLRAVQTGVGLSFTVCGSDTVQFVSTPYAELSAGSFAQSRAEVQKAAKEAGGLLEELSGAEIRSFSVLAPQVCRTTFSNGMTVTVNYGENAYTAEGIEVPAEGFVYTEGAAE